MELLSHPVVVILFTLGVLVTIHELGHFLVGKYFGMGVVSFSIGFGPAIVSRKYGKTVYRVGWIPLGGYVLFAGASLLDPDKKVDKEFEGMELWSKPLWQRALMILAGPLANLLLAACVYAGMGYVGVPLRAPVVGLVEQDSPAQKAGLNSGDEILQLAGKDIRYWGDILATLEKVDSEAVVVKIRRDGEELETLVVPQVDEGRKRMGILYGYLPPIVRVLPSSQAYATGVVSGLRVTAVGFSRSDSQSPDWVPVKSFFHLQREVDRKLMAFKDATDGVVGESYDMYLRFVDPASSASAKAAKAKKKKERERDEEDSYDQTLSEKIQKIAMDAQVIARYGGSEEENPFERANRFLASFVGIVSSEMMIVELKDIASHSLLQVGDVVKSISGVALKDTFAYLRMREQDLNHPQARVIVERNGEILSFEIPKKASIRQRAEGAQTVYDFPFELTGTFVGLDTVLQRDEGVFAALINGVDKSLKLSYAVLASLAGMITGEVPLKALGGPILIAKVATEAAGRGLMQYLELLALISINLFLINLFPIPILDGGQLMMIGFETIKGSPLSTQFVENIQKIGFAMVLALVVLATYNDISRYWLSMLQSLGMG